MNTSPPTFLGLLRPEKKSKSSHLILHFRCALAVSQDRVASTCFSSQKSEVWVASTAEITSGGTVQWETFHWDHSRSHCQLLLI